MTGGQKLCDELGSKLAIKSEDDDDSEEDTEESDDADDADEGSDEDHGCHEEKDSDCSDVSEKNHGRKDRHLHNQSSGDNGSCTKRNVISSSSNSGSKHTSMRNTEDFCPGALAHIRGLQAQPLLNGQTAVLDRYDTGKERWVAQIPAVRKTVLLRELSLGPMYDLDAITEDESE